VGIVESVINNKSFTAIESNSDGKNTADKAVTPVCRVTRLDFDIMVGIIRPDFAKGGSIPDGSQIGIGDAFEILKYLAGMKSRLNDSPEAFEAALITGEGEPVIDDVLEILKYLSGIRE